MAVVKAATKKLKGLLGDLDDSLEARMKRAREMGFDTDTVYYHGTIQPDIKIFSGERGSAAHLTDDPEYASEFAKEKADYERRGMGEELYGSLNLAETVYPTYIKGEIFDPRNKDHVSKLTNPGWKSFYEYGTPNWEQLEQSADAIKESGFDGYLDYDDFWHGADAVPTGIAVFDPKNIRSVNAMFDPAKKESSNIMAGMAGAAPIAGLGLLGSDEADAGPLTAGARRLIDARFGGPVGGGNARKAVQDKLESMQTDIDFRPMSMGDDLQLYDLEGLPYILTQSDRSAAGGQLTGLHGVDIDPVDLRGGRDFMFDVPSAGQVWASYPSVVSSLHRRAQDLKSQTGVDPILLPYSMAPTGIDFASMPLDAMVNYARSGMSASNIKKLDRQIKKIVPDWGGISDPESNKIFVDLTGPQRKRIADIIDKGFRDVPGGLSISEARAATTDAGQYLVPDGEIVNVGRIDTSQPILERSGHPTYRAGLQGEGVGRITQPVNARSFMEGKGRKLSGDSSDIRSLSMNHNLSQGVINNELLKNIYGKADVGLLSAIAGATGLGLMAAGSGGSILPPNTPNVGQRIEAPLNPRTEMAAGLLGRLNRTLENRGLGLLAPEGLENYLRKAAYGDEITYLDRLFAGLDVAP